MRKKLRSNAEAIKNALPKDKNKRYAVIFACILIASLLCEIFVFNYKWLTSLFDKEITFSAQDLNGLYPAGGDSVVFNGDSVDVELNNINEKVKYLYFDPGDEGEIKADINISVRDEANENYFSYPARTVLSYVDASKYIRLHPGGKVRSVKINVNGMNGVRISADDIKLNARVPLMFSWLRSLIVFLIASLAFILRPGSEVYKYRTDLTRPKQRIAVFALAAVQMLVFFGMIHCNSATLNWHEKYEHHQQYYQLVESFKNGRLYIDDPIDEKLKDMENPYDTRGRSARGVSDKWDHAYYNGKYYCYFGVLPAVLLYLPYNLVTGRNLPNYIAVYICACFVIVGIMLLLWEIIKKWYKNTPFAMYMLMCVVFSAIAGLAYAAFKPDFYMIPNLSAIAFSTLGLYFWLSAERTAKPELSENAQITVAGEDKAYLKPSKLMWGSLCVALTALCRPQFLITAVLGIMLFWDYAFKKRKLFSKTSVKQTVSVCLPFVIVGAVTMWYNAARFGSPFDFGANYNLTTNDMTHRGFYFGRIGLGLFTYLVQPLKLNSVFPFLHDFDVDTIYQGLTLTENQMGGIFMLYPVLITGLAGLFKKRAFNDKRAYKTVVMTLIMAAAIVVVDSQMAGLLIRYTTDFAWLLMIASVITIFAVYESCTAHRSAVIKATLLLSAATLALAFLSIFAHTEDPIVNSNPILYYTVQHMITFWM